MTLPARASSRPLAGLAVVGLGASLASMDVAVNVAFPAITAAFSLETRAIRWVVVYYVVTYACLMLAFGRLGDAIGHRQVFRAGLILGVFAYAGCALAPDYSWLLLARIVQGISTALVLSCAPALATQLFAEDRRTKALSAYAAMSALAAVVAPVVGGLSIVWLDWSGVFWFRVPIVLLALAALPLVPATPRPPDRAAAEPDRVGPILLAAAIASLLLSPSVIGAEASPSSSLLLGSIGIVCLLGFVTQQHRTANPFFPRSAVRDLDFVLLNLFSIAVNFVAFAVPLLVPYYLARISGYGGDGIGAALALSPLGMLLGSVCAPRAARAFGTRRSALLGACAVTSGSFLIAAWPSQTHLPLMLASLLLNGAGLGLFQVAYTDVTVSTLARDARGVAGSLTMVTRTIGVVTAASALTGALAYLERRHGGTGDDALTAFAGAFSTVFLAIAIALAVLLALGCLRRRLWLQ